MTMAGTENENSGGESAQTTIRTGTFNSFQISTGTSTGTADTRVEREKVLDEAKRIVVGDRDKQYSGPESSFAVIAQFWTTALQNKYGADFELEPADVALFMTLLKTARLITGGNAQRDTWVDVAGYAACGFEVAVSSPPAAEPNAT